MKTEFVLPGEIEKRSFEIIAAELNERNIKLDNKLAPVICRAIHTTADFDYEKEQYLNAGYSEKMAFGIESHSGYKTLKAYNFAYVSDKKVDFEIYLSYTYDQKNFEGYIKI